VEPGESEPPRPVAGNDADLVQAALDGDKESLGVLIQRHWPTAIFLAAKVHEVRITRLVAPVFYATVLVSGAAGSREVDARPSDAVNLALVTGAPIRVEQALFDVVPPRDLDLASLPVVTADIAAREAARLQEALELTEETER
jgi:bifunctional nuclease